MKKHNNYFIINILVLALMIAGCYNVVDAKENVGIKNTKQFTSAKISAGCNQTSTYFDLAVNNIRARINTGGDLWYGGGASVYEIPNGSGNNSLYSGSVWFGGFENGTLKVAGQTYRQTGIDFWTGPINKNPNNSALDVSPATCESYDRFWQITKTEVEAFVAGGTATEAIKEWPGNGNFTIGELPNLAPYVDVDNSGDYNYQAGDYPKYNLASEYPVDPITGKGTCNDYLFGDRTLWWVFNDVGNSHTETGGEKIGLEVRSQAFGFKTNDEINNMTFYKYEIINRGNGTIDSTYMGFWVDPDLGQAADDFVGCDVHLGLGFVYNGDAEDDGAGGYGFNPPACGIDFFQGPKADIDDDKDNDRDGCEDCTYVIQNGVQVSIPDAVLPELIAMSKFMYYNNFNNTPDGNPNFPDDYYQYLSGTWLDGLPMTYGGSGRDLSSTDYCDFMFPGTSDDSHNNILWDEVTAGNPPEDRRFIQSAGTFTLLPGAVNNITVGAVWARASSGGPTASVSLMKLADVKAQALFDNCFKVLDGPDAPTLEIRELDRKLIINLVNTSNPKTDLYNQLDATLPTFTVEQDTIVTPLTDEQRKYKFQGYKIYQIANQNVSSADLDDPDKAILIEQIDLKDDVTILVNYSYESQIGLGWVPKQETKLSNNGLKHSIVIERDLFSQEALSNFKPYYFMAVAYAHNNFKQFDPSEPITTNITQDKPYLAGRNGVVAYSAIPHKPVVQNGGTVLNVDYDASFQITRIEGQGNGGNILDLTEATVNSILTSPTHDVARAVYTLGHGPIKAGVADQVKIKGGDYQLKFDGVGTDTTYWTMYKDNDSIDRSTYSVKIINEQINADYGLKISANDVYEAGDALSVNSGLLDHSVSYSGDAWLTGVADVDGAGTFDWIRSGTIIGTSNDDIKGDEAENFEGVIGGTWAPYLLLDRLTNKAVKFNSALLDPNPANSVAIKWSTLNSVDIVITPDKSKWTRCIVLNSGAAFKIRGSASVDKQGRNSSDPNYVAAEGDLTSTVGMGWFPGYAINIESGERLNMAFAEDSTDVANNGSDMLWNPSSTIINTSGSVNDTVLAGRHYIYVFNKAPANIDANSLMPKYDFGAWAYAKMAGNATAIKKSQFFKCCIWAGIPALSSGYSFVNNNVPPSEVKVRLRVAKSYNQFLAEGVAAVNGSNPFYEFSVPKSAEVTFGNLEAAKDALNLIRVVPNPYYAYSAYENTIEDSNSSRVRITNLPPKCTVSIYTTNGTLVRQFKRDVSKLIPTNLLANYDILLGEYIDVLLGEDTNLDSGLDWDLKNTKGITVASGIYLIHVDGGELGEKIVKWFGVMRPIDLDSY